MKKAPDAKKKLKIRLRDSSADRPPDGAGSFATSRFALLQSGGCSV